MTLHELSQLYYIKDEIRECDARLTALKARRDAGASSPPIGGSGGSGLPSSPTERLAAEITDLEAIISAKKIELIHQEAMLTRYIASIDDSLTRMVFTHRFITGLSWAAVAMRIGGGNTPDGVKKICYRYIKKHG